MEDPELDKIVDHILDARKLLQEAVASKLLDELGIWDLKVSEIQEL